MPPIPAPAKALVTGANGFIGAWVVRTLLEQGYSVLGIVRSAKKGEHLNKLFASYGDKFSLAIVDDITKPGAFDEVVKDVQLVVHTASPCHLNFETPSDLIDPAVRGTTGILESVLRFGTSVRRVVITSSAAAIQRPVSEHTVLNETSWNDAAIEEVKSKGSACPPMVVYRASKTLAEKAAWRLVEENKPKWDLVTFTPPFVFGPPIHEVTSLSALNSSMQYVYDALVKGDKDTATLATLGGSWLDVRDLARAHVLAAQKVEAGSNRFIVSASSFFFQDIVDAAADNGYDPAVRGEYGATKAKVQLIEYDTSKAAQLLGMEYISLRDMIKDTMIYFKEFSA
ncbi:NAD(P)-binding protein [Peniophora sp. CONT]|nr:NAD(P)-binding protein [Peniophora sp. CONT]